MIALKSGLIPNLKLLNKKPKTSYQKGILLFTIKLMASLPKSRCLVHIPTNKVRNFYLIALAFLRLPTQETYLETLK